MAIDPLMLTWYQSAFVSDNDSNGGGIGLTQILTATKQNIFPNVPDDDRVTGGTQYRKIYLKNTNEDSYTDTIAWLSQVSPNLAESVSIVAGGSYSVQGQDSPVLGGVSFTFAASATVLASASVAGLIAPGEKIFNSSDDTNASAGTVASISSDGLTITLEAPYAGTAGSGKSGKVAGIEGSTFVTPTAWDDPDVLEIGDIPHDGYRAIWIKRTLAPGGLGYTNDGFTISVINQ